MSAPRRTLIALTGAAAAAVTPLAAPGSTSALEAPMLVAASASSTFPLADPDTLRDGSAYYTYGTSVGAKRGKRCGAPAKGLHVPVLKHGSGTTVGMSDCAVADALPNGPGAWADRSAGLWAPGVAKFNGKYWLYYTAKRAGSEQRCIGKAVATSPKGPFTNKGQFACPPKGRWAIDANPYVSGSKMYVAYRDDAVNNYPQSGLSAVRVDANGSGIWKTRKTLLTSTDVKWESTRQSGKTHVVENPTMVRAGSRWFLMFSGNSWASARYATGIADCGTNPLPASKCKPISGGVDRPYFGYTGNGGLAPFRDMPGNHTGPGGIDTYTAPDGTLRVTWHWFKRDTGLRYPKTATLTHGASGFKIN